MRPVKTPVLATGWGLAEATFFFIVPDVLLSWYALHNRRQAALGCVYALIGALVGGAIMWLWGRNDVDSARHFLAGIPAINASLITTVQLQLEESGLVALFAGPLRGIPYKIYVIEAAELGYGLAVLMFISIPARLMRFVAVAVVVGALGQLLRMRFSLRTVRAAHISGWLIFYVWYFRAMSGG